MSNELPSSKLDSILTEGSFPRLLHLWSKFHGFRKRVNSKGQTLIEVVIGLALAILVLGALINAVITSLYNSNYARSQAEATKIGQKIMEQVRINRDQQGWVAFSALGTATGSCYYLNNLILTSLASCTSVAYTTTYKQLITITQNPVQCSQNCSEVRVVVSWNDSNCAVSNQFCHTSKVVSYLSRW